MAGEGPHAERPFKVLLKAAGSANARIRTNVSSYMNVWGFPGASVVQNPPAMQGTWVPPLGGADPRRRAWQPTAVFLPGELHGQRSQAGYGPCGDRVRYDLAQTLTKG